VFAQKVSRTAAYASVMPLVGGSSRLVFRECILTLFFSPSYRVLSIVALFQYFEQAYLQLLMKISVYTALSGLVALALAVRPSQAAPSFLQGGVKGVRQDRRALKTSKTSGGGGGGSTSTQSVLLDDSQCFICTPENKIRPTSITVQYFGGPGQISQ